MEVYTLMAMQKELTIDALLLRKGTLLLRVINNTLRQQILKLTQQQGQLTVTQIYIKLKLEQSVASQHLAILRRAGFVKAERKGKHIFYSIHAESIQKVHKEVYHLLGLNEEEKK